MDTKALQLPCALFFIGIGGTGMSGLALIANGMGYEVSGSDIAESETTIRLRERGIQVYVGHCRERVRSSQAVIVSSAIPPHNEELCAARLLGIPVIHRGEMLAFLLNTKRGIAISGTHGKTTTTSMISLLLEIAGMNPTVLIGGELEDIGGNAKNGEGEYFVAEADESDGSFLQLRPYCGIITNIEDDHLEHYGDMEGEIKAFQRFLNQIKPEGFAVVCADHPNVRSIMGHSGVRYISYGITSVDADFQATLLSEKPSGYTFKVVNGKKAIGHFEINIPGVFNVLNSLACISVGLNLGIPLVAICEAVASFSGVKRRFERIGEIHGALVVDDYAHHPTEMDAVLQTALTRGRERVIVIFQPHRYTRTYRLFRAMARTLLKAHRVMLLPVYSAGEEPIDAVSSQLVLEELQKSGFQEAYLAESLEEAAREVEKWLRPGDLVITMGAGDVWKIGTYLCAKA